MKRFCSLVLMMATASWSIADTNEYFGVFEATPMFDLSEYEGDTLERIREMEQRNRWILEVNKDHITITVMKEKYVILDYISTGQHFVGIEDLDNEKRYWPFYFSDGNTVYFGGRKFVRVESGK